MDVIFASFYLDFNIVRTVSFNVNDTEFIDKIKKWSKKKFVVNDLLELPDDPLGFSDAYKKADFNNQYFGYFLRVC